MSNTVTVSLVGGTTLRLDAKVAGGILAARANGLYADSKVGPVWRAAGNPYAAPSALLVIGGTGTFALPLNAAIEDANTATPMSVGLGQAATSGDPHLVCRRGGWYECGAAYGWVRGASPGTVALRLRNLTTGVVHGQERVNPTVLNVVNAYRMACFANLATGDRLRFELVSTGAAGSVVNAFAPYGVTASVVWQGS